MSEPLVCCVMLTKDRPEMARRAVECFRSQTYTNKHLIVYDTGSAESSIALPDEISEANDISYFDSSPENHHGSNKSIGYLRNRANHQAEFADAMIHWDDDDWSHPNRIAEQVAFLQHSGADAVGYREMLFWREEQQLNSPTNLRLVVAGKVIQPLSDISYAPEAWLYSNPHPRYCLGTSLCYWRSAWERNPFPDTSRGEEGQPMVGWQSKLKCASESSLGELIDEPRMIASLHGGNTCSAIDPNSPFWHRVPKWDGYCRERMAL